MRLVFHPYDHRVTVCTGTHILQVDAVGDHLFRAMAARSAREKLGGLVEELGAPIGADREVPPAPEPTPAGIVAERIGWSGDV